MKFAQFEIGLSPFLSALGLVFINLACCLQDKSGIENNVITAGIPGSELANEASSSLTSDEVMKLIKRETESLWKETEALWKENEALWKENGALWKENEALREDNKILHSKLANVSCEKVTLEELDTRVVYLEAITRPIVPRTCQDLKNAGVTKSGGYLVDPDGPGIGDPPISAECNMSDGSTTITHNMMATVDVDDCPDPGCHTRSVVYTASDRQIQALKDLSTTCTQNIKYDCFATALSTSGVNYAWWTDSSNVDNFYWDGKHGPTEHMCSCAASSTCADPLLSCNCDAEAPSWMADEGVLTDMAALPVKKLYFGGLSFAGQEAKHTLGGLVCKGKKTFSPTSSCQTLRDSGHMASGYFFLDDPSSSSGHYKMTFCDMTKANGDSGLQKDTQAKVAAFPVAFDAYTQTSFDTDGATVPFDGTKINLGNGMAASTGKFTAPASGVYLFSFNFDDVSASTTNVEIRRNGASIGRTDTESLSGSYGSLAESVVVQLAKGDVVECIMTSGLIHSGGDDDHFVGVLIFPL